jgi:hypothetical protein
VKPLIGGAFQMKLTLVKHAIKTDIVAAIELGDDVSDNNATESSNSQEESKQEDT